jgi:hypothetical protein
MNFDELNWYVYNGRKPKLVRYENCIMGQNDRGTL